MSEYSSDWEDEIDSREKNKEVDEAKGENIKLEDLEDDWELIEETEDPFTEYENWDPNEETEDPFVEYENWDPNEETEDPFVEYENWDPNEDNEDFLKEFEDHEQDPKDDKMKQLHQENPNKYLFPIYTFFIYLLAISRLFSACFFGVIPKSRIW